MITCKLEPLSKEKNDALRLWLGKSELELLKSVVRAQAQRYGADAINQAAEASPDNMKLDAANAALRRAKVYENFLEVLEEVLDQKEPHQIAKLS